MERNACPVCGASGGITIDHVDGVPVMLNRLANTTAEAHASPRGILDIAGCGACGFVWNRAFEPEKVLYDPNYENDQTHSNAFRGHMARMAAKVMAAVPADDDATIVEVGCGQAVFLRALTAVAGRRLARAVGFDPSFRDESDIADGRIHVFQRYFDETAVALLNSPPSIVVSRHTIEHVEDPIAFLKAIRRGIGQTPARLFLETPDVTWILLHGAIEDFFYEHCSLFAPHSIDVALRAAGFDPIRVESVFYDQYLWVEATAKSPGGMGAAPPADALPLPNFTDARQSFIREWRRRLSASGPIVIWGAGAKGVTFCNLVDPDGTRIAAVVDINPGKQNKFVPLTGHAVVAPESLAVFAPKTVLVMNPNYREEITAMVSGLGIAADVISLAGTVDFESDLPSAHRR